MSGLDDIARERIAALDRLVSEHWQAHDDLHLSDTRTHDRELELADEKFAKANEVREQIDRERNTFATRKELESVRDEIRREAKAQADEANRRAEVLERRAATDTGERSGRSSITSPMVAALWTAVGAVAAFVLERVLPH